MDELSLRSARKQRNIAEWSQRIAGCHNSGLPMTRQFAERGIRPENRDLVQYSLYDRGWLYKVLGVNAELLIDHAWGIETTTMRDIKACRLL